MSKDNKSDSERIASIETMVEMLVGFREDQEKRIRTLEIRDAYVFGAGALLSAIAPIIAKRVFGI